jgi:hypothetical protein
VKPATPSDRICAALDFPSWREAEPFARTVAPAVGMLKVGLELFVAEGPPAVRAVAALGRPVFLDLKLHDIPNTVERAARSAAASGAALLTVHAAGGAEMVRAAVRVQRVQLVVLEPTAPLAAPFHDPKPSSGDPLGPPRTIRAAPGRHHPTRRRRPRDPPDLAGARPTCSGSSPGGGLCLAAIGPAVGRDAEANLAIDRARQCGHAPTTVFSKVCLVT